MSDPREARPGDSFPNVGYVRGFLGRDIYPPLRLVEPLPDVPLIGIIGKKRAGKDTFASGLIERGYQRFAFADPLKAAVLAVNPLVPAWLPLQNAENPFALDERLADVVHTDGWEAAKERPEVRRLLQNYGVAIREIDEDFWVRATLGPAIEHGRSVITDVRFPNEASAISAAGGVLIRINRPGLVSTDQHVSETALDGFPTDLTISNTGTPEELVTLARTLSL